MGINPYGLFNSGQSGSPYNNRKYELERQLQARQQQLDELEKMPSLSARQLEKREQLLHAVDTLSGKINPPEKNTQTELNSIGNRDTADGIVIPKSKMEAANAYSKMDPAAGKRRSSGYAGNEYSNSGTITYKNPGRYDGNATTPQDTYLKGFFVDIKL